MSAPRVDVGYWHKMDLWECPSNVRPMSAFRGEADIRPQGRDFRF